MSFNVADLVVLRSGGPVMVVLDLMPPEDATATTDALPARYECMWFNTNQEIQRDTFIPEILTSVFDFEMLRRREQIKIQKALELMVPAGNG